eukprot:2199401-Amphidinium_carterae.1
MLDLKDVQHRTSKMLDLKDVLHSARLALPTLGPCCICQSELAGTNHIYCYCFRHTPSNIIPSKQKFLRCSPSLLLASLKAVRAMASKSAAAHRRLAQ